MGKKPKYKMTASERAKQFMPFSALTGFEQAIAKVEEQYYQDKRRILSESEREALDQTLAQLIKGDQITVQYYNTVNIEFICGKLNKIDDIENCLLIGEDKISIKDIISIEKENSDEKELW